MIIVISSSGIIIMIIVISSSGIIIMIIVISSSGIIIIIIIISSSGIIIMIIVISSSGIIIMIIVISSSGIIIIIMIIIIMCMYVGMGSQGPQQVVVAVKFGVAFLLLSFLPWLKVLPHSQARTQGGSGVHTNPPFLCYA